MGKLIFSIHNIFLFVVLLSLSVMAPLIDDFETWDVNGGTQFDHVIWTDDNIDFEVNGPNLNASSDFVCFDWNNDGTFDRCYYDSNGCGSSCNTESCNDFSVPGNMNDALKEACDVESDCREGVDVANVVCSGCSGHSTSSIQNTYVNAKIYHDCTNPSTRREESLTAVQFWVVNPQKFDCDTDAGDSEDASDNNKAGTIKYDLEGKYGSGSGDWKNVKSDLECQGAARVCDSNSAHTYHDDQEVTTRTGTVPSACSLADGSTISNVCLQNADCYSGNCGGWSTDEKHVCVTDGSNNYYQQFKYTNRTCGGGGYTDGVFYTNVTLSCAVKAGPEYVCDADHDENVTLNPTTPALPCKKAVGQPCSQDSDCWNDDGGVLCTSGYCKGPPTYCTGNIEVLTEDSSGAPLKDLNVYWNLTYNGTTDALGQKIIGLNVTCSTDQNVTVKCSDNSTICGTKLAQIDSNGDIDFLYFECAKCSPKKDIYLSQSDVSLNVTSGKINVTVHSAGITSNVQVAIYRQDENGVVKESNSTTISLTAGSEKNASLNLSSISATDFLHVYIDENNAVKNEDETNNYVFRAAVKPVKAYIDVKLDPSFSILNELIKEYIATFVEPSSSSDADVVIIVGHPRVSNSEPFNITGTIIGGGKSMQRAYAGVVKKAPDFANSYSGKPEVLAYGNGIQGDVAAVKRMVNARSIFLDKGTSSKSYTVFIDDYDTLGISVMDLMSKNETKQHLRNNNISLANDVRKILFDNNFEVAVKPVKTLSTTSYGNSSILRVKNVNSDFSASYRDATGISNFPVVFSGGLFSHLTAWEGDGKGLAKQMAGEGWDVWEIEMTGGPDTDCSVSDVDTCPNYIYGDLTTYYWPALIAGIQKYSGKGQVDYVGHSNGCLAALGALNNYSLSGKNNSGYYFDYNTGQYLYVNLSSNSVRRFVGVACPSILDDTTAYTTLARLKSKFGSGTAGDVAMTKLAGKKHITMGQYAQYLVPKTPTYLDEFASFILAFSGGKKISYNLMDFYNDLAVSSTDTINLSGVNVSKLYLFAASPDDGIVPYEDQQEINNSASLIGNSNKQVLEYAITDIFDLAYLHIFIKDQDDVKTTIKERLK